MSTSPRADQPDGRTKGDAGAQRMLEFDYGGYHRVVQPYCRGFTRTGAETLRAVQVNSDSHSGGRGFGKL